MNMETEPPQPSNDPGQLSTKQIQQQLTKLRKQAKNNPKQKKELQTQIQLLEQDLDRTKQQQTTKVLEPQRPRPTNDAVPRQQRRKLRKQAELEELHSQAQLVAASMPDHAVMESELLAQVLAKHGLRVFDIIADGHCLFNAIAHQLNIIEFPVKHTYQSLRTLAGNHIIQNRDDYLPFLIDEATGLQMNPDQLEEYVNLIIHTPLWGGHTEIKALSASLEVAVHVFHPHALDPLVTGSEFSGACLRICFVQHQFGLGEHYNSLVQS